MLYGSGRACVHRLARASKSVLLARILRVMYTCVCCALAYDVRDLAATALAVESHVVLVQRSPHRIRQALFRWSVKRLRAISMPPCSASVLLARVSPHVHVTASSARLRERKRKRERERERERELLPTQHARMLHVRARIAMFSHPTLFHSMAGGLPCAALAGVVIGAVLLLCLLGVCIYYMRRARATRLDKAVELPSMPAQTSV